MVKQKKGRAKKEIGKLVKRKKYRGISLRVGKEVLLLSMICLIILSISYGAITSFAKIGHKPDPFNEIINIYLGSSILLSYKARGIVYVNNISYGVYDSLYVILSLNNRTSEVMINLSGIELNDLTILNYTIKILDLSITLRAYTPSGVLAEYLVFLGFRGADKVSNLTDILIKHIPNENINVKYLGDEVINLKKFGLRESSKYLIENKLMNVTITEWVDKKTFVPLKLFIKGEGTELTLELEAISLRAKVS